MSKRSFFRTTFDSQRIKGSKTRLKSARKHFDPLDWSIRDKLSWRLSLLIRFEILRLFVNTLTDDDKHYRHCKGNFAQSIQIPISKMQNIFSTFLVTLLKLKPNFEHFGIKDESRSLSISNVLESNFRQSRC